MHILVKILCLLSPEERFHSVYRQKMGTGHVFRLGPLRAVTVQRAGRPKGFHLTLQIQPGPFPHTIATIPVALGFGVPERTVTRAETFSVDGVRMSALPPPNARRIYQQRLLDYTGMFIPVSGILVDGHGRVQVSMGSRLRFNGRILLSRRQTEQELALTLGKADFSRNYMNMGPEDAPLILNYYYRDDCQIEVGIVNDAYLENHFPKMFRRFWSGRICFFRIRSWN